ASPVATTSYILTVTDVDHSVSTDTVIVTVNITTHVTAGADTVVGLYAPIALGGSPTASGGTTPYHYAWSPATGLSSTSVANPNVSTASGFTSAYLTVTDSLGCYGKDSVKVMRLPVELGILNQYALLSGKSAFTQNWIIADGKIGVHDSISPSFETDDSILKNRGSYASAISHLSQMISDIKS